MMCRLLIHFLCKNNPLGSSCSKEHLLMNRNMGRKELELESLGLDSKNLWDIECRMMNLMERNNLMNMRMEGMILLSRNNLVGRCTYCGLCSLDKILQGLMRYFLLLYRMELRSRMNILRHLLLMCNRRHMALALYCLNNYGQEDKASNSKPLKENNTQ
jgi:hypothetical protein